MCLAVEGDTDSRRGCFCLRLDPPGQTALNTAIHNTPCTTQLAPRRATARNETSDLPPVVELERVEAARHRVDHQPHHVGALAHLAQADLLELRRVDARRDAAEELVARRHRRQAHLRWWCVFWGARGSDGGGFGLARRGAALSEAAGTCACGPSRLRPLPCSPAPVLTGASPVPASRDCAWRRRGPPGRFCARASSGTARRSRRTRRPRSAGQSLHLPRPRRKYLSPRSW